MTNSAIIFRKNSFINRGKGYLGRKFLSMKKIFHFTCFFISRSIYVTQKLIQRNDWLVEEFKWNLVAGIREKNFTHATAGIVNTSTGEIVLFRFTEARFWKLSHNDPEWESGVLLSSFNTIEFSFSPETTRAVLVCFSDSSYDVVYILN